MTQNVDLLFKVKVLDEASGKLQKVLNSFRKLDAASKKQITANIRGIRESASEIRARKEAGQQIPGRLFTGIARRGGAIEGALGSKRIRGKKAFTDAFSQFETTFAGRRPDVGREADLSKQQATGQAKQQAALSAAQAKQQADITKQQSAGQAKQRIEDLRRVSRQESSTASLQKQRSTAFVSGVRAQQSAGDALQKQRSAAFVAEQNRGQAESKRVIRLKANIRLTQQQIQIEGQTEQSLRRLAAQHRALAQAVAGTTSQNQRSVQSLLSQTAALNAQANAAKTFGFGVVQRSKAAAKGFATLSSGAAGFMLASSALDGNLTNVAFSLIFLQFAMGPVVALTAAATIGFGLLFRRLQATKKVTNQIKALALQLRITGSSSLVTLAGLQAVDRLVDDFKFDLPDASKAVALFAGAQLDLGHNLDVVAKIAALTGRTVEDTAKDFIKLVKPNELVIGSLGEFETTLNALFPAQARGIKVTENGTVAYLDLQAANIKLFSSVVGLLDPNERLTAILDTLLVSSIQLQRVDERLVDEEGKLLDGGKELTKVFGDKAVDDMRKRIEDLADAAGIEGPAAFEGLGEAIEEGLRTGRFQDSSEQLQEFLESVGVEGPRVARALGELAKLFESVGVSPLDINAKIDIKQLLKLQETLVTLAPLFRPGGLQAAFKVAARLIYQGTATRKQILEFLLREAAKDKTITEKKAFDILTKFSTDDEAGPVLEFLLDPKKPDIVVGIKAEFDSTFINAEGRVKTMLEAVEKLQDDIEDRINERDRILKEIADAEIAAGIQKALDADKAAKLAAAELAAAAAKKAAEIADALAAPGVGGPSVGGAPGSGFDPESGFQSGAGESGVVADNFIDNFIGQTLDTVLALSAAALKEQGILRALELEELSIVDFFGAKGGIVRKPSIGLVGEAGPEAIIPLNKLGSMGSTVIINIDGNLIGTEEFLDLLADKLMRAVGVDATGRF